MSEIQKNEETIREYLLGRISDEKTLEEIEELLFTDDEFCDELELIEDQLINAFAFGELNQKDRVDFEKTLENNPERKLKVQLEQRLIEKSQLQVAEEKTSVFDSIRAFFSQPIYAGAFGLLLIVALISMIYFLLPRGQNELVQLKNIYEKERPFVSRISGFEYAPYVAERSGQANDTNKNRLRLIENKLLEAFEKSPNAANSHALGVFYLTQRKFEDSIKNLKKAMELDKNNAKYRNDLGTAYFEYAKNGKKDKRLENFARANEEFTKAFEQDGEFLTALFNRSLALQELNLQKQAEESWNDYLKKDSNSKWADEARKNLERLTEKENSFKTKEQVLDEFLTAYREKDEKRLWQIHNETKGVFNGTALHQQLTRKYLLARKQKDEQKAKESLEALKYIGEFEKEKHADFFFVELGNYYSKLDESKLNDLLEAKKLLSAGVDLVMKGKYTDSIESFRKSKEFFLKAENEVESNIAELWVAEMLPDVGKIEESRKMLNSLISNAENKKYKVILPTAFYWLGVGKFRQKKFSAGIADRKKGLQIAEETENDYEFKHLSEGVAVVYNILGEFNNSLNYLSIAKDKGDLFYSNKAQTWRNLFTTSQLLGKLNLDTTAIDFANESVKFSKTHLQKTSAVDASFREKVKNLSKEGNFTEALKSASEANKIALEKGENSENFKLIADSFLEMANVKSKMGSCLEALKDFEKALEFYSKLSETTFNLYDVHKGRLLCFQKLNQQTNFQNELKTVLEISEEYRQNIREDNVRQTFFESEQVVFDVAVSNALDENRKQDAFAFLETSNARSLLDFIKSEKSIAEIEKEFSAVSKPLGVEEIQTRMPENVQIVQYSLLGDKLAIWVLEKEKFELFEKSINLTELEDKIREYRKILLEKKNSENLETLAREFFELLIPENLDKEKTLCLVLDKSLYQIPFASLVSPNGTYLIEDFALLYSPSSSVFVIASENAKKKESEEKLLSIGNPQFDREENPNLADLPNAEDEALEIAKDYLNAKKFVGEDATKKEFLDNFGNSEVIHFAGHFVANGESTVNSKLVFADESLRSFEFADKKLNKSKLVVLSACETAFEKINKSEGAIGIGRIFLAMRTPIVVASNWKVDSEATKDLMISFHQKRRKSGLSSVESLRQAQIELLKKDKTKAPFYWSAFSAIGGFTEY